MSAPPPLASAPAAIVAPLFRDWQNALPQVPVHLLYRIEARSRPHRNAATLDELTRVGFVFRVANAFVAEVGFQEAKLVPPVVLRREPLAFRFTTLPGPDGIISPAEAAAHVEAFLIRQRGDDCAALARDFERPGAVDGMGLLAIFRGLAWRSLRLDQPFAAGVREPTYTLAKALGQTRFLVGARTGTVRLETAAAPR